MINWDTIIQLARAETQFKTLRGKPFTISRVNETTLWIRPHKGFIYTVERINLDKAVRLINEGVDFSRPTAYRKLVSPNRASYAWAILRHLGYISQTR